jgi:hypothetical protein
MHCTRLQAPQQRLQPRQPWDPVEDHHSPVAVQRPEPAPPMAVPIAMAMHQRLSVRQRLSMTQCLRLYPGVQCLRLYPGVQCLRLYLRLLPRP